jgi:hypothetical protein
MNAFLKILDAERKPGEHIVLVMDRAGWHVSKRVRMPDGITALLLPPASPELNPVENLWHYLRSHYLSNRTYGDYDALFVRFDMERSPDAVELARGLIGWPGAIPFGGSPRAGRMLAVAGFPPLRRGLLVCALRPHR